MTRTSSAQKRCVVCRPLVNKRREKANSAKSYARNKPQINARSRVYYATNREVRLKKNKEWYYSGGNIKTKLLRLQLQFGLTPDQYNALQAYQSGQCAICSKLMDEDEVVDHDHEIGVVRGLLCRRCNLDEEVFTNRGHLFERHLEYRRSPPARQLGIHAVGQKFKKTLGGATP